MSARDREYLMWAMRHDLSGPDFYRQRSASRTMAKRPLISILTPVYNTDPAILRKTIASVQDQSYPDWELCLVDDGSQRAEVAEILRRAAASDPRILVRRRLTNGGIVAASNDALELATGELVALLDHDDELAPDALYEVAAVLDRHPDADLIYTDEDKIGLDGNRFQPFFKPDWSPEYLLTCMYTAHLSVYRRSVVEDVGGFRPGFEGSQDYDLALRVAERTDRIHHIPKILYHWRVTAESTAAGHGSKPYAHGAGRRALAEHIHRRGLEGMVEDGPIGGCYRVRFRVNGQPLVSIVIPTAGGYRDVAGRRLNLVVNCVESIVKRTEYARYEIVVVYDGDLEPETESALRALAGDRLILVPYRKPFNFSDKVNLGTLHANGDYFLLLNDDVEVLSGGWIRSMLEYAQQKSIGAVGAKLFYPNGEIQHAGVVVMDRAPHHVHYRRASHEFGHFNNLQGVCNYSAVTGACLMSRRDVFYEVGGFDTAYAVNFNDVDYCLKVREHGYRLIFTPHAALIHYESVSRTEAGVGHVEAHEIHLLQRIWGDKIARDPYYNVNFRQDSGAFALDLAPSERAG
jgi:GT2 family glycosyltransferase